MTGSESGLLGYPVGSESSNSQYEIVQPFQNGEVNLTQLLDAAGTIDVDGKPINKLLYDALQAIGSGSIGSSASREAGPRADVGPMALDYGGVPVPSDYEYDTNLGTLNDFCTLSPDDYNGPGDLDASFRGPCARHDMCYDRNIYENGEHFQLGFMECNRKFKQDLQTVCTNVYTSVDPRRSDCMLTGRLYYDAVVAAHPSEWDEHIHEN